MQTIRTATAYVPQYNFQVEPSAREVDVRLVKANDRYFIKTPWAMLDATGREDETDLIAAVMGHRSKDEAHQVARARCPSWHDPLNETVRERLLHFRHFDGDLVGDGSLADQMGISRETLHEIALGKAPCRPKFAAAAVQAKLPNRGRG